MSLFARNSAGPAGGPRRGAPGSREFGATIGP